MIMHSCSSSMIRAYGYDIDEQIFEVEFESGPRYRYRNVPYETFIGFIQSPSKGKYFAAKIRGGEAEKLA